MRVWVHGFRISANTAGARQSSAEGGYVAWLEEMSGMQTQGETQGEAKDNLLDALGESLGHLREKARRREIKDFPTDAGCAATWRCRRLEGFTPAATGAGHAINSSITCPPNWLNCLKRPPW